MPSALPRSFLFVPASRPDRFEKAVQSGAHQVILDLEDAVAPDDKDTARGYVAQWPGSATAVVRINGAESPWFAADLEMIRRTKVGMVMVPKADPRALNFVAELLGGKRQVIALIETVEGYANLREICKNTSIFRLSFGNLDFGVDAGVTETERQLDPVRLQLVLESRLARLPAPIDGVTTAWSDVEACCADIRRSKALGFGAKLCIHPAQVGLVNDTFLPTPAELAWARRIIDATTGRGGAIAVDGKMVDGPVIDRAKAILAAAAA